MTDEASVIQAIDKASVAKICSGQVILDLATAVKELVENALDAGATSVEVRLKEHGLQLIEVSSSSSGKSSSTGAWWGARA
jgi:DNA mismatch repair protein PMS2